MFISYRHSDAPSAAGRLHDGLSQRLGADNVVRDVEALEPGRDFLAAIKADVARCQVLLVVIGRRWLDDVPATRLSRLDDPDDVVRLEVETALEHRLRVIPVLVEEASVPTAARLPPTLRSLPGLHACVLSHRGWKQDLESLVEVLRRPVDVEARQPAGAVSTRRPAWASVIDRDIDGMEVDSTLLPTSISYGIGAAFERREPRDFVVRSHLNGDLEIGTRRLLDDADAAALAANEAARFPRLLDVEIPPAWRDREGCAFILTDIPYFQRAWAPGAVTLPAVLDRPAFAAYLTRDGRRQEPAPTNLLDLDMNLAAVGWLTLIALGDDGPCRSPFVLLVRCGIRHPADQLFGPSGRPIASDPSEGEGSRRFAFVSPAVAALTPAIFTADYGGHTVRCIAGADDAYHNSFTYQGRHVAEWVTPYHLRHATHRSGAWALTVSEDRD